MGFIASIFLFFSLLSLISSYVIFPKNSFCSWSTSLQGLRWKPPSRDSLTSISMANQPNLLDKSWLPPISHEDLQSHLHGSKELVKQRQEIEMESIELLAGLIKHKLKQSTCSEHVDPDSQVLVERAKTLVQGKFRDLTDGIQGELQLEALFLQNMASYISNNISGDTRQKFFSQENPSLLFNRVILGAVVALQSLCILGAQVGVKGTPDQLQKMTDHLEPSITSSSRSNIAPAHDQFVLDNPNWDQSCIRRLKYRLDVTAGIQLLAALKKKRSSQGAFDLLVNLGFWTKHEDVALIRSGFQIRFTDEEDDYARQAAASQQDPDTALAIRQDLRHLKVYTIDRESTLDIDDGLSIQRITRSDGSQGFKIWIHIADADRWAPRDSNIFHVAQERTTSIYLPTGCIPMFPSLLSNEVMALRANHDSHALSLVVELNHDGSIIPSSIEITPSIVHVDYRLSYDEVDEMLEQGTAYFEEWEIGALLSEANKRRKYRMAKGSSEEFVPKPIPQAEVNVVPDVTAEDNLDIKVDIEVSHNAGLNHSSLVATLDTAMTKYCSPLSPAFLLVTEMMVLAGEALGLWAQYLPNQNEYKLRLPYRSQGRPDYAQRQDEFDMLETLKHVGHGYCHAWYARRFFEPVRVSERILPHYGLGLDTYVQWTSPIRRFTDLQVHAAVKRHLRITKIKQMLLEGMTIPDSLQDSDVGYPLSDLLVDKGKAIEKFEINFDKGAGFLNAARVLQKKSKEYWLFEYIRRNCQSSHPSGQYEAVVLGCVDPQRLQYAIYIHNLGLEHRYVSEKGRLNIGETLWLNVAHVSPRQGLLTFSLGRSSSGKA